MAETLDETVSYNKDTVIATTNLITANKEENYSPIVVNGAQFSLDLGLFDKIKKLHNQFPPKFEETTQTGNQPIAVQPKELSGGAQQYINTLNLLGGEIPVIEAVAEQEFLSADNNPLSFGEPEYSEISDTAPVSPDCDSGCEHQHINTDNLADELSEMYLSHNKAQALNHTVTGPKLNLTHTYDTPATAVEVLRTEEAMELETDSQSPDQTVNTLKRKKKKNHLWKKVMVDASPQSEAINDGISKSIVITSSKKETLKDKAATTITKAISGLSKMSTSTQEHQKNLIESLAPTTSKPTIRKVPDDKKLPNLYDSFRFGSTEFQPKSTDENKIHKDCISREELKEVMTTLGDTMHQFKLDILELVNKMLVHQSNTISGLQDNMKVMMGEMNKLQATPTGAPVQASKPKAESSVPFANPARPKKRTQVIEQAPIKRQKKPAVIQLGRIKSKPYVSAPPSSTASEQDEGPALGERIKKILNED